MANHLFMDSIEIMEQARLEGRRTKPAVFAVEHIPSSKRYVVGCRNLSKRLSDQRRYLAQGDHHNPELRRDLKRDGAESFRFVILSLVPHECLLRLFKRRHVAAARASRGGCYNAPNQQSKDKLHWDTPAIGEAANRPSEGTAVANPTAIAEQLQRVLLALDEADRSLVVKTLLTSLRATAPQSSSSTTTS